MNEIEKLIEERKQYKSTSNDYSRLSAKIYRLKNPERNKEIIKKYRDNTDGFKDKKKAYREANRDKIREQMRIYSAKWRAENQEKIADKYFEKQEQKKRLKNEN